MTLTRQITGSELLAMKGVRIYGMKLVTGHNGQYIVTHEHFAPALISTVVGAAHLSAASRGNSNLMGGLPHKNSC